MYKTWVLLLAATGLLLGACAGSSSGLVQEPPRFGNERDTYMRRNERLLADFDGWRVWEFTDDEIITCMAVKPAPGADWPSFSDSTLQELKNLGGNVIGGKDVSAVGGNARSMQLKIVPDNRGALRRRQLDGGAGFFMYLLNQAETPYFGFYGKYPYRLPAVATVAGSTVADPNSRDAVLAWEGQSVSFRVNTRPSETSTTLDETSGTIDFTGVRQAYDIMLACYARGRS